jgi:hypothetical protein
MAAIALRRGDLVEVRSPAEILATLDDRGTVAGLPFMPEMAACCGQRFVVDRRADKICDTVKYTGSLRMVDAVLLGDMRCNGAEHAGCEAECRIFWKSSWLRKVEADTPPSPPPDPQALEALLARTRAAVNRTVEIEGKQRVRWFCQNTEIFNASEKRKYYDPLGFIQEVTSGNVKLAYAVHITARAVIEETRYKMGARPHALLTGTGDAPAREPLNLQAGDWVRIRSKEEIAATLTPEGYNRGMWFDREMAIYCGGIYRVRRRITKFIDEYRNPGQLVKLKDDAVTLDTVVCKGENSLGRWLCPREIYPYWRECWLERVPAPADAAVTNPDRPDACGTCPKNGGTAA